MPVADSSEKPSRLRWLRRAGQRFGQYVVLKIRLIVSRDLPLRQRLRHALGLAGRSALAAAGVLFVYTLILIPFTPSIKDLRQARIEQPTVVLSADGKVLATYKPNNRDWVPLNRISPHVVDALISTEDRRFYHHHGIDFVRTAGALLHTMEGQRQGGSTITQQLARNLYPDQIGNAISLTRKLKEMITAFKIESVYSKDQILETYLNTVPFLYNAYGIEMASRTYFNKDARDLNVLESATLVGMLKGTAYYNPVLNPERAVQRRNLVLEQMSKMHKLGNLNLAHLESQPLKLDFAVQPVEHGPMPYFAEYLRRWLIDWADRNGYNIYSDGLVVQTTIDSRIQAVAHQAVAREGNALQDVADVEWGEPGNHLIAKSEGVYQGMHGAVRPFGHFFQANPQLLTAFIRESDAYKQARAGGATDAQALTQLRHNKAFLRQLLHNKSLLEAGLVVIDPASGNVLAWVGGRNYDADQYDHVDWARRQPGSTFKPFLYAAALEKGYKPTDTFKDEVTTITLKDGEVWKPNDAEKASGRPMTLRDALAYSKNTVAAQLVNAIGPDQLVDTARIMGIDRSDLEAVPSLALGTSPVSLLEITSAYGTIVDNGRRVEPVVVTSIKDRHGQVLATFTPHSHKALDPNVSMELLDMMRSVVDKGTGRDIRAVYGIRGDVAGKTGTSQNGADGWFIMLSKNLVVGSWVGFDDPRVTFRSSYWGQGGHNALHVVGNFYRTAADRGLVDTEASMARYHPPKQEGVLAPALDWLGNQLNSFGQTLHGLAAKMGINLPFGNGADNGAKQAAHHHATHPYESTAPVMSAPEPASAPASVSPPAGATQPAAPASSAQQPATQALPQPWQGAVPPAPPQSGPADNGAVPANGNAAQPAPPPPAATPGGAPVVELPAPGADSSAPPQQDANPKPDTGSTLH